MPGIEVVCWISSIICSSFVSLCNYEYKENISKTSRNFVEDFYLVEYNIM
jgi:hypothetical protein